MIISQGFPTKINLINTGTMTANEGDSSQFIFVARAILAGFESSNVDVRSSRYDCIVEFGNKIFWIQVKRFKDDTLYFKSRPRGGKGIDPNNPSNQGKRITREDCDIYAGVDKKTGIVYLIPIEDVEKIVKNSMNIANLSQYRENWNVFEKLTKQSKKVCAKKSKRLGVSSKKNRYTSRNKKV